MVELPVVCGRSSLEPEVLASGFSFFTCSMKLQIRCQDTSFFIKDLSDKTQRKDKFVESHKFGEKKERKKLNRVRKNYKDGLKSLWELDRMRWELNEQHN